MLIPNIKFLSLPLIALAVIVALAAPRSQATSPSAQALVPAQTAAQCGHVRVSVHCLVAAEQSVLVR
jgi:hypothetical protein